jgi:AcrR family transcriptional regulator
MTKSRGRRPAGSGTREAITAAAREQFAERGYERTTFRSVAEAAGVDPGLVVHFHGSKAGLFRDALALTVDPGPLVEELLAGPREALGERLARTVNALFENPATRATLLGRVRSAASNPEAAALVREMIRSDIVGPLVRGLGVDQTERRAALVSSQMIGYVVARAIIGVDALAEMSPDETISAFAPTYQRYLAEPL